MAGEGESTGQLDPHEIVAQARPLVAGLARRFAGTVPIEDLEQSGMVGALEAARTFDPGRGVPFTGYAVSFITGEMLATARAAAPTHVSRGARELARRVEQAGAAVSAAQGRPATVDELADEAELDTEQVIDGLRARAALAAPVVDDEALEQPELDSALEAAADRLELGVRMARLDRRSRAVIALRFGADLSQAEIGRAAGDLADARLAAPALGARWHSTRRLSPDPSGACRYPRLVPRLPHRLTSNLIAQAGQRALDDNVNQVAQAIGYNSFLAIPSVLLVAVGAVGIVASQDDITSMLEQSDFLPPDVVRLVSAEPHADRARRGRAASRSCWSAWCSPCGR